MDKTKILFICLGNICRSPAANAIMQEYVDEAGLSDEFEIDSAGIGPWHVGQLPDKRMRQHGAKRGYKIDHIARQFDASRDFDDFDYIVVMDDENYKNITWQAHDDYERNACNESVTAGYRNAKRCKAYEDKRFPSSLLKI